jgi:hypothetical protein
MPSLPRLLRLLGVAVFVSTAACASSSAVRVGTVAYAPLPPTAPVSIFYSEHAIGQPYAVVGEVKVENPGKWEVLTVDRAALELAELARRIGANGVIVDANEVVVSGIVSRGFGGRARAIRVFEPGVLIIPTPPGARGPA